MFKKDRFIVNNTIGYLSNRKVSNLTIVKIVIVMLYVFTKFENGGGYVFGRIFFCMLFADIF